MALDSKFGLGTMALAWTFSLIITKGGKRLSKGQYLLLIVGETLRQVVGLSGLLIAIIGY
jgi:hypothetical protein